MTSLQLCWEPGTLSVLLLRDFGTDNVVRKKTKQEYSPWIVKDEMALNCWFEIPIFKLQRHFRDSWLNSRLRCFLFQLTVHPQPRLEMSGSFYSPWLPCHFSEIWFNHSSNTLKPCFWTLLRKEAGILPNLVLTWYLAL